MKVEEFFSKYSNTPLDKRLQMLDILRLGDLTLQKLYVDIHRREEDLRRLRLEQQDLIDLAEKFLPPNN